METNLERRLYVTQGSFEYADRCFPGGQVLRGDRYDPERFANGKKRPGLRVDGILSDVNDTAVGSERLKRAFVIAALQKIGPDFAWNVPERPSSAPKAFEAALVQHPNFRGEGADATVRQKMIDDFREEWGNGRPQFMTEHVELLDVFPGAEALWQWLHDSRARIEGITGLPLAFVTDSPREVKEAITNLLLQDIFNRIFNQENAPTPQSITRDDVNTRKKNGAQAWKRGAKLLNTTLPHTAIMDDDPDSIRPTAQMKKGGPGLIIGVDQGVGNREELLRCSDVVIRANLEIVKSLFIVMEERPKSK